MFAETGLINVLDVDDEPDFLELAAKFLRRQDGRIGVQTRTDASDALGQRRELDVDCIVSDYDMPGQNGIEFRKAVRENFRSRDYILPTHE
ncbi:MAG: response regulator [Halobacteriales archaeon]|nr:response regulator [Halobacteriales archaeon]